MSGPSRRAVLKGAALVSVIGAPALAARAAAAVLVFDSRLPESRAFARGQGASLKFDLAEAHQTRFAKLRSGLPASHTVEGLTRWSDLVALRRELGRQGFRLKTETRTPRGLYRWTMT